VVEAASLGSNQPVVDDGSRGGREQRRGQGRGSGNAWKGSKGKGVLQFRVKKTIFLFFFH